MSSQAADEVYFAGVEGWVDDEVFHIKFNTEIVLWCNHAMMGLKILLIDSVRMKQHHVD